MPGLALRDVHLWIWECNLGWGSFMAPQIILLCRVENHRPHCLNIWNTLLLIKNPNSLAVGQGSSDLILSAISRPPDFPLCWTLAKLLPPAGFSKLLHPGNKPMPRDSTQQILSGSFLPMTLKNFQPSAKFLLISTWVPQVVANMFF